MIGVCSQLSKSTPMIATGPFLLAENQRPCNGVHGEMVQKTTHAVLPCRADKWESAIMPLLSAYGSPTLGSGRRGRPGERGRVNLRRWIIGRLLLAAVVCLSWWSSKGNDADRLNMPYRSSYCRRYNATCGQCRGHFQTSNKIRMVANGFWIFKKTNV